jgi:hypothetical protein
MMAEPATFRQQSRHTRTQTRSSKAAIHSCSTEIRANDAVWDLTVIRDGNGERQLLAGADLQEFAGFVGTNEQAGPEAVCRHWGGV